MRSICVPTQVHVEHREGEDLTSALREAEAAVMEELGYTIALTEKPMYGPASADEASAGGTASDALSSHSLSWTKNVRRRQSRTPR